MDASKTIYMYIMGAIIVLGFIVLLAVLVFQGIPPSNSELLYLAVGAFMTQVGTVINYFFSSSKSSSDKNQIIADQLKK